MTEMRKVLLRDRWGYGWKVIDVPLHQWPPPAVVWGERLFLREGIDERSGLPDYRHAPDPFRYEAEAEEEVVPAEIPIPGRGRGDEPTRTDG